MVADHARVASEPIDPIVVSEHDDGVPAIDLIVFLRAENAAESRLDAEHREEVSRDHFGVDALGLVVDTDGCGHEPPAQHLLQRLRLLLEVLIERIRMHPRPHVAPVVVAFLVEHDQLVGLLDRQLSQQHLVDERENGRVGADAKSQGQDRHQREQRAAAQPADREPEIGQNGSHRGIRRAPQAERLVRSPPEQT
jgi:hypothetical protein